MAIALELLSPTNPRSQRNWIFETESVVRLGHAIDNQIALDDSVISEYHAMLWGDGEEWKIVNLSCNGTYLDDKPITHALLKQGAIIRLAVSGPQIRFRYVALDSSKTIPQSQRIQESEARIQKDYTGLTPNSIPTSMRRLQCLW